MNNINTSFKKIYSLLILTFLCFLILINKTYSEEKIGSVVALKGEIIAINTDDEKRTLDIYDDIFLFDEIVTNNSSSVTIQYNDNSTVIIKSSSSLTITEFVFSIAKKKYLGIVKKGKVIIESGKIAKSQEGSMEIQLPTMILGIKGTRFNMKINPDGTSEVGLSEDSFGEVGTINISSDGKVQTLYDTDQVISANIETGISERPKTDDEKKELVDASNDLIEASSIDDNLIQEQLEEKLANGTLLDANNDGIIDLSDIDIIKENIKIEKQENINFIVENSTGENTEFLSNVLNISDEASIGESMNQILETNDYLVASVITNLSNEDNTFLTTSNVEANNAIKEKIFTQMLNDSDDENNNIAVIGSIFAKSDAESVGLMMDTIQTVGGTNENSTLALEVFSSMADSESFYDMDFGNEGDEEYFGDEVQEQYDQMMEQAVYSAADSEDGAMMLANMMTNGSEESIYMMMDTIGTMGETNPDSTLALEVLSSMADSESFYDMDFGDEGQEQYDKMMEQAVYSAADSEDGAMMLANMMTNGSEESIYMMMDTIQTVGETNPDSTLALEVLSSMADSGESFDDMDFGDEGQEQYDQMMEEAVFSAADSEDGAMMLANMMANGSEESIYMMMDTIQTVGETNPDSTLALEVLSSMADSGESFDDMDFGDAGQEQYDQMMEQAVYSAADSEDGATMLANIITEADADTVGTMLDYISDVSENDEHSTLGAEVLSSVASTAATSDTYFDTEKMDQFKGFIDTTTSTTTAVDGGVADDMYDAYGFDSTGIHRETGTLYNMAGFDRDGNSQDDGVADDMYDAYGFDSTGIHRETGTLYNMAGFDKYGNSEPGAGGSYDAYGFDSTGIHRDTLTLYDYAGFDSTGIHRNGTLYNMAGFDRDGNSDSSGSSGPTWSASGPTVSGTLTEGTVISAIYLSTYVQGGVGSLSFSSSDLPPGLLITAGSITGTPAGDTYPTAETTANIVVTDGMANTDSYTMNIPSISAAAASGPTWSASGPTVSGTLTEGTVISAIYLSTYVQGGVGSLSFSSSDLPPGLLITAGSITGTPAGDTYPTAETTANIVVTDGMANTDSYTMNIPSISAAAASGPTWSASGPTVSGTLTEGTVISAIYLSTYVQGGVGSLSFSSSDLPPGLLITAGSITGTPAGDTYPTAETTANIVVTDGMANTDSYTMNIPSISAAAGNPDWVTTPSDLTFTQNQSGSETAFTATANPNTNTISYSLSGTADGAGLSISDTTGELTGYFTLLGTYTANITATDDDNGNSISESINITVYDAAGYDAAGYDAAGRDSEGYNSEGFDENGFDRARNWDENYDEIDDVSAT